MPSFSQVGLNERSFGDRRRLRSLRSYYPRLRSSYITFCPLGSMHLSRFYRPIHFHVPVPYLFLSSYRSSSSSSRATGRLKERFEKSVQCTIFFPSRSSRKASRRPSGPSLPGHHSTPSLLISISRSINQSLARTTSISPSLHRPGHPCSTCFLVTFLVAALVLWVKLSLFLFP